MRFIGRGESSFVLPLFALTRICDFETQIGETIGNRADRGLVMVFDFPAVIPPSRRDTV